MAEGQVTIEGQTRLLGEPFFVVATQNPISQSGTFPLPESQLDRFLMRIELGYPDPTAERRLFRGIINSREVLGQLQTLINTEQLSHLQEDADRVNVSDSLLDYLQRLIAHTRTGVEFDIGLSPRGAIALLKCAKAWALIDGRNHVIPEDIQAVLPAVAGHRLNASAEFDGDSSSLVNHLLTDVAVIV
jgi:MoxR-like ATPase